MRKLKGILSALMIFAVGLSLMSCGENNEGELPTSIGTAPSVDNTPSDIESTIIKDQREAIYKLAVESGYSGSYEEWLESIKGDEIVLKAVGNKLMWKYSKDTTWIVLIDLTEFKGENGLSAYDIYKKYHPEYDKSEEEWINDLINGTLIDTLCTVTFVYDLPNMPNEVKKIRRGFACEIPYPYADGYRFLYWTNMYGERVYGNQFYPQYDTVLVAKWERYIPIPSTDTSIPTTPSTATPIPTQPEESTEESEIPLFSLDIRLDNGEPYEDEVLISLCDMESGICYKPEKCTGGHLDLYDNNPYQLDKDYLVHILPGDSIGNYTYNINAYRFNKNSRNIEIVLYEKKTPLSGSGTLDNPFVITSLGGYSVELSKKGFLEFSYVADETKEVTLEGFGNQYSPIVNTILYFKGNTPIEVKRGGIGKNFKYSFNAVKGETYNFAVGNVDGYSYEYPVSFDFVIC